MMTTDITIRPYAAQDSAATIGVFVRAIRDLAKKDYTPAQIDAWAQVEDPTAWGRYRLTRPTWVAVHDAHVIGFADLTTSGYLDMLFVHPDYQGLGVASRLFACVEAQAQRLALKRVYTEASITARPFFERKGFTLVTQQSVEKRGQCLTNFLMDKHYPIISITVET